MNESSSHTRDDVAKGSAFRRPDEDLQFERYFLQRNSLSVVHPYVIRPHDA